MKNLFKFLLAVVALAVVGCTTDATEDLDTQFGGVDGQQTITLSLEESRTQLGTDVDGLYPLTWSKGDKISVNGVESGEAVIDSNNPASATFTIGGTPAKPYCIAYPAAAEGQVLFAANQEHAGNTTFGNGVATMYGYSESGLGVQLHHLTGVLKIGITGSHTLNLVQISTVDRAPIAGAFELDFATGELTATKSAKDVISYAIPASEADGVYGLELSNSTPQYIHVAVPAGEYDELYVTLYDNAGGVMYATVKADDTKPLAAGKIRTFSNNIVYSPNASVFVVKDVASLKEFAAQAATLDKDVLFVADVDMTGEAWTPIDDYTKTVIGNGYAIKGLTAPLFGRVFCSIKGLHLVDVNIEETANQAVGALARHITAAAYKNIQADDTFPVVEHCSVTGKIVMNNATPFVNTSLNDYGECVVAGLVGRAYGTNISDCVNHATIEVKQFFPSGHSTSLYPSVGGVVGYVTYADHTQTGTDVKVYSNLNNLVNHADVSVTDRSHTGETNVAKFSPLKPYIGGVIGCVHSDNKTGEIHNITNFGDVSVSGVLGNGVFLSGTFGYATTLNGSHFYNHGTITAKDLLVRYIYIGGGVGGSSKTTKLDNVHNYGAVNVTETATCGSLVCGGLQAYQSSDYAAPDAGNSIISNSSNSAPVTVSCQTYAPELHDGTALYYRVGGLAGWNQQYVQNCNNLEGATVTCTANLHNIDTSNYSICVGGLIGYKTVNAIDDSHNDADVICNINMTSSDTADLGAVRLNIGGISGYTNLPCRKVTNNGDVTWSGSVAGQLRMGGVLGQGNTVSSNLPLYDNCVNNGAVTIADNSSIGHQLMIGGVSSYLNKNANCTNNGPVTIGKNVSFGGDKAYIGGALAYVSANTDLITNNGPLKIDSGFVPASTVTHMYIGGCLGYDYAANVTNLENTAKGTITVESSDSQSTIIMIGGCLGCAPADKTDGKTKLNELIENFTNRGAITHKGGTTMSKAHYIGGCVGYSYEGSNYHAPTTNQMYNYGAIKFEGGEFYDLKVGGVSSYFGGPTTNVTNYESGTITFNATTRRYLHFAGAVQCVKDAATDLVNYGDITINGKIGHTLYGSGCITLNNNYTRTRNSNHGDITVNAEIASNNFIGGLVYDSGAKLKYVDCHNTGNFILGEKAVVQSQTRYGGFVGKLEKDSEAGSEIYNIFDGCSNSGDIIIKGSASVNQYVAIGSIYGTATGNTTIIIRNGFTNSGDIVLEGSLDTAFVSDKDLANSKFALVGGLFGHVGPDITFANADNPSWTGDIVNTGAVKFTGSAKSALRLGGFAGSICCALPVVTGGKIVNTGDIVCTGTYNTSLTQYNGIGGIVGYTQQGIDNAVAYCNINVPAESAGHVGMITGCHRSDSVVATNCEIGGKIVGIPTGENDANGDPETEATIGAENYYKYIYGTEIGEATAKADFCSFITVAPTLPTTPPATEETPAE